MNKIGRILLISVLPFFVVVLVKMIATQDCSVVSEVCSFAKVKKDAVSPKEISPKKHVVSVFVHGAILPYPSWNALKQALSKKDFFSTYQKNLRFGLIYKCQMISDLGLRKVDPQETNGCRTVLLADAYKKVYQGLEQHKNTTFSFYTFGWDGVMTSKSRKQAGFDLYKALVEELKKFEMPDTQIVLEVLAHSHGGNVCLNLATAEQELKKNLIVDRLMLFGTPVVSETSPLVEAGMFKKVYNFYSTGDVIQVCDIISSKDFHSKRCFEVKDTSKLYQLKVVVGNHNPLHNELWFLNERDNLLFRNNLAITPLPFFVFTPLITHFIEDNNVPYSDIALRVSKDNADVKCTLHDLHDKKAQKQVCMLSEYEWFKTDSTVKAA